MRRRGIAAVAACSLFVVGTATAEGGATKYEVDRANFSIPAPLTATPGDPANGRKVAIDRKRGNCLACHTMPIPEQPFHGRIAPPLNGIGARYDSAQLRLRVVNPKELDPMSIMPAFYMSEGLHDTLKKFAGKTILSAQEVEDVIAYLSTLK